MTINERIKYLRKEILKLSQKEFGQRIGMKQTSISDIESGKNGVSDSNAKLICQEFNISEAWLRNGEGNIYAESSRNIIGELKKQYGMTDEQYACMCAFLSLERNEREFFIEIVEKAAATYRNNLNKADSAQGHMNRTDVPANNGTVSDAERAEMHRQLDKQIDSKGKLPTSTSGSSASGNIA